MLNILNIAVVAFGHYIPKFITTAVVAKAAMLVMLMGLLAACSTTPPTQAQLQLEQMYDEGCGGETYCH